MLVIGLATGFGSEPSAEPTAQAFLLDWQQQHYAAAGALATAPPGTVAADLADAFTQLDASQVLLSMSSVIQHGSHRRSVVHGLGLSRPGQGAEWTYQGRFGCAGPEATGRWNGRPAWCTLA